jgi:hypothetical protein
MFGERESLYTVGRKANWYNHYGKQYGVSTKKIKNRTIIWPSYPMSGYIYKDNDICMLNTMTSVYWTDIYTPLSTVALFTKPIYRINLYVLQWMNVLRNCDTHSINDIQRDIILPCKEGNSVICKYIDEPKVYYSKWNKPETEQQTLYVLTYSWNILKSQTPGSR